VKRINNIKKVGEEHFWRHTLKSGLTMGIFLGLIFGIELGAAGDLLPYPIDSFIFILALSLLSIILSVMGLLIVGLFWKLIRGKKAGTPFITGFAIFMPVFIQLYLFWIEANRPLYTTGLKFIGGGIGILIVSIAIAFLLLRLSVGLGKLTFAQKLIVFFRRPYIWLPNYIIVLMIILAFIPVLFYSTPVRKEPVKAQQGDGKVLFLGVDAAYWPTLEPLIQSGQLPHFKKLVDEGAHGQLPTLISMYNPFANTITHGIKSAAIWTSMMTGKSPAKHGIKDFVYTRIPGIAHPYRYPLLPSFTPKRKTIERMLGLKTLPFNRLHRKTKAVWNMLTDVNGEVGAIGWWMTWPAEMINGDLLTDRFDDPHLPKRWFPEELVEPAEVDSLLYLMKNPDEKDLSQFTSFQFEPDFKEKYSHDSEEYLRNDLVSNLVKSYYQDKFRSELGLRLLDQHHYKFFSVYFYGIDTAGHAFMRFKYPDLFKNVDQKDIDYFGHTIDSYYQWVDAQIGKYMDRVDENTTIVLCSDHGMGPWLGARLTRKEVRLSGSHRKNGIIILWGNHIRQGATIEPKNVLDVLPTMLYLMGLPVAEDMDGSVISDAIEPDYLQAHPIQKIDTYETERYHLKSMTEIGAIKGMDESMMQRLRALGYLK